jgi:hypothetical protein
MFQIATKFPNGQKIHQKAVNGQRKYQLFAFQGPPKFTQIWTFGLKAHHLATLLRSLSSDLFIVSMRKKWESWDSAFG